jgi:hypothetical protein
LQEATLNQAVPLPRGARGGGSGGSGGGGGAEGAEEDLAERSAALVAQLFGEASTRADAKAAALKVRQLQEARFVGAPGGRRERIFFTKEEDDFLIDHVMRCIARKEAPKWSTLAREDAFLANARTGTDLTSRWKALVGRANN